MRKINELIWHCTATPEGREVTAAEIDRWHKDRGWSGIGYHKVVHLDGSVSEGRPISKIGAHVKGHNTGTIGYVYVGGLDKDRKPKDTRTDAQKRTMIRLSQEAKRDYGVVKISGHRDYAAKACPCFDASGEYKNISATSSVPLPKAKPKSEAKPKNDKPLKKSRTVGGAVATGAGTAGTAISDAADTLFPLTDISPWIKGMFVALTIIGIAVVLYARWDDAGRPKIKEIFG